MDDHRAGRLLARPSTAPGGGPGGLHAVDVDDDLVGVRYVPTAALGDDERPLVLLLHGAGGRCRQVLDLLVPHADRDGLVLAAPQSVAATWDVLGGGFGPDVARADALLSDTFARYAVDPSRVVVGGFSDGASYALSLGLTNGDLFSAVLAFSPGFVASGPAVGRPRVYVSHGDRDRVLPVDRCGRRVVASLRHAGYDVRYDEFSGGHTVPPAVVDEAVGWLLS